MDEGLDRVQPLVARLEEAGPSRGLALLYLTLAQLLASGARVGESLAAAERAAALASTLGDAHMAALAEMRRGYALNGLGRSAETYMVLQHAVPLAESVGDLQCLNRIFNLLAHVSLHQGAFQASLQAIDRALALAERIGDMRNISFQLMHRGYISFCAGDWGQARIDAERAADLCRQVGTFYVSGYPFMVLGFISFGEGDWAAATEHLHQAVTLADAHAPEALVMAQSVLVELDLLERRPDAARARILALLERFGPDNCDNAYLLPKLAWAQLESGEIAEAEAVDFAQRVEDFLNLVEATRVRALVLMAQRRWGEAERALADVLVEARSRRYPWGEARILDTYGLLHTRAGESGLARERLEAALTIYTRLGARKDVERTKQLLATLS